MRHAWLLDVLNDLRGFAQEEGFDRLVERFDDVLIVAEGELTRDESGAGAGQPPADLFVPADGDRRRH